MDAVASELCTHASKIKVSIDEHDILDVLVDGGSAVNAMSERLLSKLGCDASLTVFLTASVLIIFRGAARVRRAQ